MTDATGPGNYPEHPQDAHEPPPSPFGRVIAALGLSRHAFHKPIRTADWLVPILLIGRRPGRSAGSCSTTSTSIRPPSSRRRSAPGFRTTRTCPRSRRRPTLGRMDQFSGGAGVWASTWPGPIFGVILLNLLLALLLLLVGNFILGGEAGFRALWFLASLSWAPAIIGGLLRIPLAMARSTIEVTFGPAAFMTNDGSTLYRILSVFDIFDIWRLLIVIVGLQVISRLSSEKAGGGAIAIWVLGWIVAIVITVLTRGMPGTG